jgi:ubiquitin-protein ligase
MLESPRTRRLRSDLRSLQQLAAESSIFEFQSYGSPPDFYMLTFKGRGFWKPDAASDVLTRDEHEVHVRLGASYPRMMPELAWKSPVFHPNISASGVVCLGGYGTYWVPSLSLDELCTMLWDMVRFENFDEKSPYNREAAAWAKNQTSFRLPVDSRPLRDKLAAAQYERTFVERITAASPPVRTAPLEEVVFLGDVVEAELVTSTSSHGDMPDRDVLYIE